MTPHKICQELMKRGILTARGGKKWHGTTIVHMLTNEKYKGSALLQKSFTVDFLTKKKKKNEGEVPQYYVENRHPPIISPEEFELVQAEIARRQKLGLLYSGGGAFSSKIICGTCGGFYGSKLWHSTDKYRKTIWRCNNKYKTGCTTPHLYEDTIKERFIEAYNHVNRDRDEFISSCRMILETLTDTTDNDNKIELLYSELDDHTLSMQTFIMQNAMRPQEEDFYSKKVKEYDTKKSKLESELKSLENKKTTQKSRKELLENMVRELENADMTIAEFDEKLWQIMIESVTVKENGSLIFEFRNGMKYEPAKQ